MYRRSLLSVLAMLLSAAPAAPAPGAAMQPAPRTYTDSATIPDTLAYRRALLLAACVNANDAERTRAALVESLSPQFLREIPIEEHVSIFGQVTRELGPITVHAARSYDPPDPSTHAVLIVRSALLESWRAIVVDVEPEPPHRIVRINLAQARPPSNLPPAERLDDQQIAEHLAAYVGRLADAGAFSGTVLLARHGTVLLTRAAGLANRDFDAPVTLDTKFNLGSMNKMMTAIAVMQLAESGSLSLDDPVSMHLGSDWLPKVDLSTVHIRHLLNHTSGLGSYFTDAWERTARTLYRTVDDWKPVIADETLAFEPGTRFRYSNTGMLIAGAIVERVSGLSFDAYVRRHITEPAGMADTDFYETDRVTRNLAVGYEPFEQDGARHYRNNLHQHVIKGGPAGGGYSTAPDLLRFDRALRSGALVSPAALEQLWTPAPASPGYGLGFGVQETPAGRVVGHGGGFPGISANLDMYLDEGYTVIVLSNLGGAARSVEQKARELIDQGR